MIYGFLMALQDNYQYNISMYRYEQHYIDQISYCIKTFLPKSNNTQRAVEFMATFLNNIFILDMLEIVTPVSLEIQEVVCSILSQFMHSLIFNTIFSM